MTAALTRIVYSERSEAKIVFYKKNDWETIETMASQYDKFVKNRLDNAFRKFIPIAHKSNYKNPKRYPAAMIQYLA